MSLILAQVIPIPLLLILNGVLTILQIIMKLNLVMFAICFVNAIEPFYNCALIMIVVLRVASRSILTILFLLRIRLIPPYLVLMVPVF